MIDDNNPYRSPETYAQVESEPASAGALVRRGRAIYLGIAVVVLVCQLPTSMPSAGKFAMVPVVFMAGLLFVAWLGRGWAVLILAVLTFLGALSGLAQLAILSSYSLVAAAVLSPLMLLYGAIPFILIFSESVNAFFRHQERHFRGTAGTTVVDNRRNVVEITPAAAELTRARISDRGFPPETALRVVLGRDGDSRFDIQYDLPSEGDHEWVGESQGIVVLVDESIAGELEGLVIDAQHGEYVFQTLTGGPMPLTSASTPPTA